MLQKGGRPKPLPATVAYRRVPPLCCSGRMCPCPCLLCKRLLLHVSLSLHPEEGGMPTPPQATVACLRVPIRILRTFRTYQRYLLPLISPSYLPAISSPPRSPPPSVSVIARFLTSLHCWVDSLANPVTSQLLLLFFYASPVPPVASSSSCTFFPSPLPRRFCRIHPC